MTLYFVKLNGRIFGPFSGRKLQTMKDSGLLREDTPVSSDRALWRPAVEHPWLFPVEKAPPIREEEEHSAKNRPLSDVHFPAETEPPTEEETSPEAETENPPDRVEFFAHVISLLWNPAGHVEAIRTRFGERGCLEASALILLFFTLSVSLSLNLLPALKQADLPVWRTIALPLFPVLFLTAYTVVLRLFFGSGGEEERRIRASDLLTGCAASACWGVLLPFAGVLAGIFHPPAGTGWPPPEGVLALLLLFFLCCGTIISVFGLYESWTGFGTVKKTTALFLLPFVLFFSIVLVMIHL